MGDLSLNDNDRLLNDDDVARMEDYESNSENTHESTELQSDNAKTLYQRITQMWSKPNATKMGVALFLISFSELSGPSKEILLFDRACESNMKQDGTCDQKDNQILVSNLMQVISIFSNLSAIIGMSWLGTLTDQVGRKPAIILSSLVKLMGSVFLYFILNEVYGLHFKFQVLTEIILSMFGKSLGFSAIATLYVSDFAKVEEKVLAIAYVSSFLYMGQMLGGVVCNAVLRFGKYLELEPKEINKLPFFLEMLTSLITVIYCLLLPESKLNLPPNHTDQHNLLSMVSTIIKFRVTDIKLSKLTKYNPLNILQPLKILLVPIDVIPKTRKHEVKRIRILVIILTIVYLSSAFMSSILLVVFLQYGIYIFNWDSQDISNAVLIGALASIISLSVIYPFLTKIVLQKLLKLRVLDHHFDSIDVSTLTIALAGDFIGFIFIGLAKSTMEILLAFPTLGLDSGIIPTVTAVLTKYYPATVSGQVILSLNVLGNIVNFIAPMVGLQIYKYGLNHNFANLPFFLSSIVIVGVFGLVIIDKWLSDRKIKPNIVTGNLIDI